MRPFLRSAYLALSALAGRAQGFVIPYRYADQIAPPESYPELARVFAQAEPEFHALLAAMQSYGARLLEFAHGTPPDPRFDQDWFPRVDAAAAYTFVRRLRPRRIVEIGSGHSTRFFCRAVADAGLDTRIVAIDPAPRARLDGLRAEFVRATVQRAGTEPFEGLGAGDILFVDSSHILMPGTDLDMILNAVLPGLPPGVHVHFHDIFLPDRYPSDWTWRGYNEQNAVATLMTSGAYRVLWASRYAATRMAPAIAASGLDRLPLMPGARESSLWLVKG